MSITAGALALVVTVSPVAHASGQVDQPPRTKAERIAHHQHVVHHRQVVKQRIRARQHAPATPTPPVATPTPKPDPVKPTPVTVRPAAPTRQVVVAVGHHHNTTAGSVRPGSARAVAAPAQHGRPTQHRRAPAVVAAHHPRPEITSAAAAGRPAVTRAPARAATSTPHSNSRPIAAVPGRVVQYVQHEVDSMLPAVKIGFGLLCVLGLFMMGYAVALGRRPTG